MKKEKTVWIEGSIKMPKPAPRKTSTTKKPKKK